MNVQKKEDGIILVVTYHNGHMEWMQKDIQALEHVVSYMEEIDTVYEVEPAQHATEEGREEIRQSVQRAIEISKTLN